ncbi:HAD family acid phosphatase [Bradyrhizobium sp. dw_411]|uniref:HAD family acid phosphatase n=1 Tax=Bradyrhizobium sp. dw_411 TaxID=2720082 RepID=UPI001BCABC65|nr:HAD family acid phosphatase [Bradyrhizobium sp. dw_411]
MTRTDWFRKPLIATCAVAALLLGPGPAGAGGTCPVPAADHLPAVPPGPLNIGTIKPLLLDYHAKFYNDDVAAVFDSAQKFMEQNAAQSKRPVIVLDIDETSLTNWPNLAADDFGFVAGGTCDVLPAGPCGFNQWIFKSSAEAIGPALKLFKAAKLIGVGVIFITGRPDSQRDATVINLEHAGFDGWTELRTRPDRDTRTVQAYKMDERIAVEREPEGYTILANIGDQISDIDGGHGGCTFKVPNPFYFIP